MRISAGPNPAGPDARNPALQTAYTVRLPPPGPYRLQVVGEPGSIQLLRVDAKGNPVAEDRSRVLPDAALFW
jgi:hypothetical protein